MGIEVVLRLRTVEAHLRMRHGRMRDLGVDELRVLDTHAADILDSIQAQWPVDTSTSRDSFLYTLRADVSEIAIVIENDTDYAEYVHRAGTPADPPLYETLIPAVWATEAPALVSDLKAAIDATEAVIASEQAKGKAGLSTRRILAGARPTAPKRRAA